MPDLYIPQAQDMISPLMNLYKFQQQKKDYELEQQKMGSLEDYRRDLRLQNKMQDIISLAKDQPAAAAQMFNSDPELLQMNKGNQVKFLGVKNEWAHFETDDEGNVTGISKTGEVKNFGKIGKEKKLNEFETFSTSYLKDNPAASGVDLVQAYEKSKNVPSQIVNVEVAGENEFNKALGKEAVDIMKKDRENALIGVSGINAINEAKTQLDAGIYSGLGANAKLQFDKFLKMAGFEINGEKVFNTEAYAAATGKLVGKIIREFGAGTGLSDADREYAQKISAGTISLNEESMRKILDISDRAFRVQIKFYNKGIQDMKKTNVKAFKSVPFNWEVEEPPVYGKQSTLPKGIPEGSKQIGTKDGKPVYQAPDGKRLMVE